MKLANYKNLILFVPLVLIGPLSMDAYLPALPEIASAFATTDLVAQLSLSIFVFSFGLCQLFSGELALFLGRRQAIIISLVGFGLASFFCVLTENIYMFLTMRAVQAFFACICLVVTMATVRNFYTSKKASMQAYSLISSATALAPLIAPVLGSYLIVSFNNWRSVFAFLAMFSIFALLLQKGNHNFKAATGPQATQQNHGLIYKKVLSNRSFWTYGLCSIACMAIIFTFFSMSPHIFIKELGYSNSEFSYVFSCCALAFLFGTMLGPRILNILSFNKMIIIAAIVIAIISASLFFNIVPNNANVFIIAFALVQAQMGMVFGPTIANTLHPFSDCADIAAALQGFVQFLGASVLATVLMMTGSLNHETIGRNYLLILAVVLTLIAMNEVFHRSKSSVIQYN